MARVLVVGAGLAGARTCQVLRARGFTGWLGLVGAEPDGPYDRPPLTKDPDAPTDLRTAMGIDVWQLADEVWLSRRAVGLVAGDRELTVQLLDEGVAGDEGSARTAGDEDARGSVSELTADAVVVATGAIPLLPRGWTGPGVHVLHSRPDALALWSAVGSGCRLGVIGGGWIGCEAAATAAARDAQVTLFEAGGQLLPGRVPEAVAQRVAGWLAEVGVEVHLGTPVTTVASLGPAGGVAVSVAPPEFACSGRQEAPSAGEFGPGGAVGPHPALPAARSQLAGSGRQEAPSASEFGQGAGAMERFDQVLVGLGVRPATDWLAGTDLDRTADGSVLVDAWGRSSRPGVFAVGDAASRWSSRARAYRPGGHWTEALNAPESLGVGVVDWLDGVDTQDARSAWTQALPGEVPDPVPYVFSEIAGRTLQVLGDAGPEGRAIVRDVDAGWTAWVVDDTERLLGVCAVGRPRDIAAARRAIQQDPHGRPPIGALLGALLDAR